MLYTWNLKSTLDSCCVTIMHSVIQKTTQWSNQPIIHVCWFLKPAALEDHGSRLPAGMHHFVSLRSSSAPWSMWYDFPRVVEFARMSDVNVLLTSHIDMLFGWSNCPRATLLPKKRCLAVQFSYVQHSENIRLASTDFFLATNPHKQATGNFSRSCQNNCGTKVTQSFSNKRFQYDDLFNNLATHYC